MGPLETVGNRVVVVWRFRMKEVQYVALFPGHPYFRTLGLNDSVFRCKRETNSN